MSAKRGALAGAATGAKVGSVIPGVGTAVGAGVGAGIGALAGWLKGRKKKPAINADAMLQQLLQQSEQRVRSQQPLYAAVQQKAFNRLPGYARQGLQAPTIETPASTGDPVQDMLNLQMSRVQGQNPLYEAIQRLAKARLGVR